MWPLLARDGLALPYIALPLLHAVVLSAMPQTEEEAEERERTKRAWPLTSHALAPAYMAVSAAVMLALHATELLLPPPQALPDLYPRLQMAFASAQLALWFGYSLVR